MLACVHAGWRGTVAGVTAAAVAAMQGLGSRPSGIIAGLGPAIAADRYQVGPDVYQAVTQTFGPAAAACIRPDTRPGSGSGRWLLDLWTANRHALVEAGVPAAQIHTTPHPTGPAPRRPRRPRPFLQRPHRPPLRPPRPCRPPPRRGPERHGWDNVINRGVFDKSHNGLAGSTPRLVIEAMFTL